MYNPRLERWLSVAGMNTRRSRAGVATDGRLLYVIGGYDGSSDLNTAESYNPLSNTWSYVTPMGAKRSCFGAAGLNGLIYCCGGTYDFIPTAAVFSGAGVRVERASFTTSEVRGRDTDCRLRNLKYLQSDTKYSLWFVMPSLAALT